MKSKLYIAHCIPYFFLYLCAVWYGQLGYFAKMDGQNVFVLPNDIVLLLLLLSFTPVVLAGLMKRRAMPIRALLLCNAIQFLLGYVPTKILCILNPAVPGREGFHSWKILIAKIIDTDWIYILFFVLVLILQLIVYGLVKEKTE